MTPERRRLRIAASVFTIVVLLHNGDHLRRGGDSVGADVFWLGSSAIVLEVLVVGLVFMGHRLAEPVATIAGAALAVGYVAVHFTPERSWISDSFLEGRGSALSLAAGGFEVVAATLLAIAGLQAWRRDGIPAAVRTTAPLSHPMVLAMLVGNAVVFTGSLLTR